MNDMQMPGASMSLDPAQLMQDESHMSQEDMIDQPESSSAGPARTLKRGDACLACRKRRIRCSATKPTCETAQCARLGKDCIYDNGKTPSRISKLKDRIAQLETHIASVEGDAGPSRRSSDTQTVPSVSPDEGLPPAPAPPPFDPTGMFVSMGLPHGPSAFTPHDMFRSQLNLPQLVDPIPQIVPFAPEPSTSDPSPSSFMTHSQAQAQSQPQQTSYFGQTVNPRPLRDPDPGFQFDFGLLDSDMMDLTATMDANANLASTYISTDQLNANIASILNTQVASVSDHQSTGGIIGGWFDPHDVPPHVRDHLLDLHFSRKGIFSSLMHIPRFYARLTLPPAKRPHPALLYMMYVSATRATTQPALKQLESKFYEIAQNQIHVGIRECDRLLDVLRAKVFNTAYMFGKGWYNNGYNECGSAIRLGVSLGLHRIPSSVWTPPPKYNAAVRFTLRTGAFVADPPEDPIDLGERIIAFWAVFEIDQCTSIAYLWDSALRFEDITTPLPRPLSDYASGNILHTDDVRIHDAISPNALPAISAHEDYNTLRMKILALLSQAVRLRDLPVEPPQTLTLVGMPNSTRKTLPAASLQDSVPVAFAEMRRAIDNFAANLPAVHRLPWTKYYEGTCEPGLPMTRARKETAILWFMLANAYIHIWNVMDLTSPNEQAVLVARRTAGLIGWYFGEEMLGGYDTFVVCMWNEVAVILLREYKRLQVMGDMISAAKTGAELDVVLAALQDCGVHTQSDARDYIDIAAVNSNMLSQMKMMTVEQWTEAMNDASALFSCKAGGRRFPG